MRVLILGTGPFAVPTLERLLTEPLQIPAVITRPDVPVKGRKPVVNPMRACAEARGIAVHAPADINSAEGVALLQSFQPDLLMVCDYGQILSNTALAASPWGGINLHGSLLPKYRGAAPIQWAVWNGEAETGVTVIHMTPQLDGGPALAVRSTPIGSEETAAELEPRLALMGVDAVLEAITRLKDWDRQSKIGVVQDQSLATKARRLRKSDGILQWTATTTQIHNQVRALQPWPGTFTFWQRPTSEPLRIGIDSLAIAHTQRPQSAKPGEIVQVTKTSLEVATDDGVVALLRLQPAGKKVLSVIEFLRGYPVRSGDFFGNIANPGE